MEVVDQHSQPHSKEVVPDNNVAEISCFACKANHPRKPNHPVSLTQQIKNRAAIVTGDIPNPFQKLDSSATASVLLCTACRSSQTGWGAIANPKKTGKNKVEKLLQAWRTRTSGTSKDPGSKQCYVCSSMRYYSQDSENDVFAVCTEKRAPVRHWSLFNLASCTEELKDVYTKEFCRLSSASIEVAEKLLKHPSEFYLCAYHHNHSRYAQGAVVAHDKSRRGSPYGKCVFRECGCHNSGTRLRSLPSFDFSELDLDIIEQAIQFDEMVRIHSDGLVQGIDVHGKYACSQCLYIVTLGLKGSAPSVDVVNLQDSIDAFLVRCVLYAMEITEDATPFVPPGVSSLSFVTEAVISLRKCVREVAPGVPTLLISHVLKCRKFLVSNCNGKETVDRRTAESRIRGALAAKDVHLKRVGHKTKCYIIGGAFEKMLCSKVYDSTVGNDVLTAKDKCDLLDNVGRRFQRSKEKYWKGDWCLNEEIEAIPRGIWQEYITQMASGRKRRAWKAGAVASGKPASELFPLCNTGDCLPKPSFEDCITDPTSEYNRADMILCIRVLKVIEQVVFARSKSISGPITVFLSIAGIVELSPSFRSVENALGLCVSYNLTEKYRLRLIAEREKALNGAWDAVPLQSDSIPLCQFDNWDLLPLHAVKADGKHMPKVNGSLVQGAIRKRKNQTLDDLQCSSETKLIRLEWKDPLLLGTRMEFANSFTSTEKSKTLEEFFDVVFGVVTTHRDQLAHTDVAPLLADSRVRGRVQLTGRSMINFRSLMLSSFLPHGGCPTNEDLNEQHVVYVDVSRDPASDILIVRRMLDIIRDLIRPRTPGCPMFVVVSGDQPSYKMNIELWLQSWRKWRKRDRLTTEDTSRSPLHEWLVPFPGFFHAEKQAMYSLCKESLDGLGLAELAECAGLSASHVRNILKHGHARNNRALLFSLACALVVHAVDKDTEIDPDLGQTVADFLGKNIHAKQPCTEEGRLPRNEKSTKAETRTGLFAKVSPLVPTEVLELGTCLRKAVQTHFSASPNGRHFIGTVLFGALLPTVGFHVLSRNGHTDVSEAFWFRLTYLLHGSNHLKYQELALFYGFMRGVLPSVVISELYNDTPGSSVMKLSSFTSSNRCMLDARGWTYVHLDELLEMLMVRHLKSLSSNLLSCLENAASWLKEISSFRSLARSVTGASRAYGWLRGADDAGEEAGVLRYYNRNSVQGRSVGAMLCLMREKGFLNASHLGSKWLTNVFSEPPTRIAIHTDQSSVLGINEHGKMTTALHSSVLFLEIFGGLTKKDRVEYFRGKKFRRWTTSRRVKTLRQFMMKEGGSVQILAEGEVGQELLPISAPRKENNEAAVKSLNKRRAAISTSKDSLHLAEREAQKSGDSLGQIDAAKRWDYIHANRHLLSPNADAFFKDSGHIFHAQKSRMLLYTDNGGRDHTYTLKNIAMKHLQVDVSTHENNETSMLDVSRDIFRVPVTSYFAVQIDVKNALHYRGSDGGRGTTLVEVVTGKMKGILRKYLTGQKSSELKQVHLHIDDPVLVIPQKHSEQRRRDLARVSGETIQREDGFVMSRFPDFNDELVVPWGQLISDRVYKDELASLHLICAALAAEEIALEGKKDLKLFLYGGAFVLPKEFRGLRMKDMRFRRAAANDPAHFARRVVIETRASIPKSHEHSMDLASFVAVPRSFPILIRTGKGLSISSDKILHGESETRFVIAFNLYIKPNLTNWTHNNTLHGNTSQQSTIPVSSIGRRSNVKHSCVILSDDTDVFFILLLAEQMAGYNVIQLLNESAHSVDSALSLLRGLSRDSISLTTLYAFGGCDFLPGTKGIPHEIYANSYMRQVQSLPNFTYHSPPDLYETVMCVAYLFKQGKWYFFSKEEQEQHQRMLLSKLRQSLVERRELLKETEIVFVSDEPFGSPKWRVEVRNLISDCASSFRDLIPPHPHIALQAARARFIVHHYWKRSGEIDLSPSRLKGCTLTHGYDDRGNIVTENGQDVERLKKEISNVISSCGCKGNCNTNRCSCRRNKQRCIGCKCAPQFCLNRIRHNSGTSNATDVTPGPAVSDIAKIPRALEPSSLDETETESDGEISDWDEEMCESLEKGEDTFDGDLDELLEGEEL